MNLTPAGFVLAGATTSYFYASLDRAGRLDEQEVIAHG